MGRVFAVADLHGMLELYQKIKDFLKPEDKVYYLGDMGDRGTDCWKTVKAIMDDPQFECIMGNHEDMLLKCMRIYLTSSKEERGIIFHCHDAIILSQNGGTPTLAEWIKEKPSDRIKWYKRIKKLPTHLEYKNKDGKWIYMSHAGFTPFEYNEFPEDESLIWDRNHYLYGWSEICPDDIYIVHGHTPIPYIADDIQWMTKAPKEVPEMPTAYWYGKGHKCCIDNGAFYTKCTVMLNLDTFEVHKFYTDDYNPDEIWD